MDGGRTRTRPAWPETLIGLGVLALAGLALGQTLAIPVSPLYSRVPPTLFPFLVTGGLGLLGLALVVRGLRGGWQDPSEAMVRPALRPLAVAGSGLLLNVVLIRPLGFTLASTLLFLAVARAFGSRRPGRDLLIGLALSLAAFFGFAAALGVNIGRGPVETFLEGLAAGPGG